MEGHPVLPESEVIRKAPRLRAYSQEHGADHEFNQTGPINHQLSTIESKNLQRSHKNTKHAYSKMSSSLCEQMELTEEENQANLYQHSSSQYGNAQADSGNRTNNMNSSNLKSALTKCRKTSKRVQTTTKS